MRINKSLCELGSHKLLDLYINYLLNILEVKELSGKVEFS